jgi:Rieske Fe-S protein
MDLKNNDAKIINKDKKPVAIYKDENGRIIALSAVCTHMGCTVGWNNADKTWDCPCHHARFDPSGKVLSGPAKSDLPALTDFKFDEEK